MANTILIYDDDEEILQLCTAILSMQGFQTITKNKCVDILADVSAIQPHLILMDLWIPEIGGEQAISMLKASPSTSKNPPILIFSANADIKQLSEKLNADGYIEKPFNLHTLVNTIKEKIS